MLSNPVHHTRQKCYITLNLGMGKICGDKLECRCSTIQGFLVDPRGMETRPVL